MSAKSLEDKVAIVTGSARGIGKAVAIKLASHGADIVSVDIIKSNMTDVVEKVESLGRKCFTKEVDVSCWESVNKMVSEVVSQFGKVDILVNVAGILGSEKTILNISEEEWNTTIDVNLKGIFNCSKAVLSYMLKSKQGRIVNIASIAGLRGDSFVDYSSSKAGVIGFTMALARELFSTGIKVNAIAPGSVNTPMFQKVKETVKKQVDNFVIGEPEDIADGVLFLILNNFISGETINMSGGGFIAL